MGELWAAVWLSAKVASWATGIIVAVGVPIAWAMARREFVGKSLIEAAMTVPIVLPPTVVGYLLLVVLGRNGAVGGWLWRTFGISLVFSWTGAVVAAVIVAMPLLYLPAKSAFASVEREMEDAAKIMGADRWDLFWFVSLPLAWRGVVGGALLAFARAMGEFGATVMVLGDIGGRRTLPIAVYEAFASGEREGAWPAVIILCLVCLGLFVGYNWVVRER